MDRLDLGRAGCRTLRGIRAGAELSLSIRRLRRDSRHDHPTSVAADGRAAPGPATADLGRPVVNYTLAINYAINRALGVSQRLDANDPHETVGYHVLNLLLHLACAGLLFWVLRRTLRSQRFDEHWASIADPASLLVAGIWLLHPIQSEAILYVVQRTEIIVSACYVATLYASIRAWDAGSARGRRGWYAASVLACLLGMGSKEVMISAPLAVVLYDRAFRWTSWKQIITGGRAWFYLVLCATTAWLIALIGEGRVTRPSASAWDCLGMRTCTVKHGRSRITFDSSFGPTG